MSSPRSYDRRAHNGDTNNKNGRVRRVFAPRDAEAGAMEEWLRAEEAKNKALEELVY